MFLNKKFISYTLSSSLILFALSACGSENSDSESASGENNNNNESEFTMEVAAGTMSPEFSLAKTWRYFEEELESQTNNRINVELYINGELGGDRELTEAVQLGEIDAVAPSTGAITGINEKFGIYDYPFLFENREQAYEKLDGEPGQQLLNSLEEDGMKGLGYFENGFRNLTNNQRPVKTLEDLQGLSIRTMENDIHIDAWNTLGANPTPMSFEELYTALQQGTIDGQENPAGLIRDNNLYEVQDYLTVSRHVYSPYVILANLNFYNSLPDELQTTLDEVTRDAIEYNRSLTVEEEEDALNTLEEEGMEVTELAEGEVERFKDALEPVYEEYQDTIGSDIVSMFRE
ncbi:DctP family TRAP transporter solute-binding subunit [Salibacterium halotolerans]|uniref:Tripartite ATP-independent transporter solute receptor, DctP family n=1 Tax=Salibacterium halotolerans TaxID=1884432 RepID=A0A1I5KYB0_9BACI|nr:DctP family TRAP transporter solute-binding subunit [Salibacterium halotolerans]SFO89606.1 tripartite ATP-independent transporter solute receptor, DctP family [Salibacterium halotolerans]